MNDNKSLYIFAGGVVLLTAFSLAVLFFLLSPEEPKDSEAFSVPAGSLPSSAKQAPRTPAGEAPPPPPAPRAGAPSSLSMVHRERGLRADSSGGRSPQEAARAGDAKGLFSSLRRESEAGKGHSLDGKAGPWAEAARETMQKVVDAVHKLRPDWYDEFLADKRLKEAADRYAASLDFRAFVAALAASRGFHSMLAAKAGSRPMLDLVSSLTADQALYKELTDLFYDELEDRRFVALMRRYGKACGIPQALLSAIPEEPDPSGAAAEEFPAQEPSRPPPKAEKKKLKLKAFEEIDSSRNFGRKARNRRRLDAGKTGLDTLQNRR